jgi:murein DD-endopeptidase MepM/ murein hydrolase activator NlpD
MGKQPKRQKCYTFMVVPHDAKGKTFSVKVPALWAYTAAALVAITFLFCGVSIIYSSHLSRRLVHYYKAIAKNREQKKVIESLEKKTKQVDEAIDELIDEENKVRKMLGLKSWKSKIKLSAGLESGAGEKVNEELNQANLKLEEKKKKLEELKAWVHKVNKRFALTPSIWPLRGPIVSRFGYRVYPWKGLHTGIDIKGSYGAPVHAAADGIVSFAGWKRGYGKTVIIKHVRGTSTLYAHSCKLMVTAGKQVKKGQLICYVGNTGYTTGPHLHYEVRKNNRPINPVAYLDLNVTTASKIWRE